MQSQNDTAAEGPDGYTVSIGYVRALFDYLQQVGVPVSEICTPSRLQELLSLDTNARVDIDEWHQMMGAAEHLLADPVLPLKLSHHMKPRHAGLVGFMAMTSGTLREVGGMLVRFHHLLNDIETVGTDIEGPRFVLKVRQLTTSPSSRLSLLTLGSWAWHARWLTGRDDLRFDVQVTHAEPADASIYHHVFGGEVLFNQPRNAMLGEMAHLDLVVTQKEPVVNRILQKQAAEQMDKLAARSGGFLAKLERLLTGQLDRGDVTLTNLASELNMSPRTLQSRLEESGQSFRGVVDRVRQAQAVSYLKDSRKPLIEIALMLGFANQTSFQHAFKRWTGKSPGEFRRHS